MRAHLVQFDIAWEDKPRNHARVRALVGNADVAPGDMIVLPEMFDTGFSLNVERTAADPQRSIDFLRSLADEHRATTVGGITALGEDGRGRNRAIIVGPEGGLLAAYDKIHPFSFGREPERFSGGDEVVTFRWGVGENAICVCPAVCYDLRFPELFRAGLALGAEAFVVIANWPRDRAEHWSALLVARAIENQAWVFGVNRSGKDPHLAYAGGSLGVDPEGRVVVDAGDRESVATIEAGLGAVRGWRERFPAWRDRREVLARR